MTPTISEYLCFIAFIIIYVAQYYYHYFFRSDPILGNYHQMIRLEYNDWLMLVHKKHGDMYEIYISGRIIIMCNADLIKNMNIPSTKTKYPLRRLAKEGLVEYGRDGRGITNCVDIKSWKYNRQVFTQAMMTQSLLIKLLNGQLNHGNKWHLIGMNLEKIGN